MYKVKGNEELELIELKIYPDSSNLHVYTLYIYGDDSRPIYRNKSPILFFQPKNVEKALAESNCGASKIKTLPKKVVGTYDFYQAFRDLGNPRKKYTTGATLLNCLILLDDYCHDTMDIKKKWKTWMPPQPISNEEPRYMIKLQPEWIPNEYDFYRKIFAAFDYFMFSTEIDPYFQEAGYGRMELVRAMKYLIGDIVTRAIYV